MVTRLNSPYSTLSLSCLIKKPKEGVTYPPLALLLHGYGSNEADLFSLAEKLPPEFLVISARAPYTLSLGQYAWFALDYSSGAAVHDSMQAEESRLLLRQFIDQVVSEFNVDMKMIFLIGFSQGAIMSYSVALTNPSLVRGIAALSGRILEEIKPIVDISWGEKKDKLKVFVAHGTADKVLPIEHARAAKAYLVGLDVELSYIEYPIGHTISLLEVETLTQWLRNTHLN